MQTFGKKWSLNASIGPQNSVPNDYQLFPAITIKKVTHRVLWLHSYKVLTGSNSPHLEMWCRKVSEIEQQYFNLASSLRRTHTVQHSLNQLEMVSMKTTFISIRLSQCFYLHQQRCSHRREHDIFRMHTPERAWNMQQANILGQTQWKENSGMLTCSLVGKSLRHTQLSRELIK